MKKEVPTAVETVNNGKANRQDANKISIYKVKPAKLTAYKRKSFNVNHPKVHLIIYIGMAGLQVHAPKAW